MQKRGETKRKGGERSDQMKEKRESKRRERKRGGEESRERRKCACDSVPLVGLP